MNGAVRSVYGWQMIRFLFVVLLLVTGCSERSVPPPMSYADTAIVCPAKSAEAPPDFDGPDCREIHYRGTDPQDNPVWLRVEIDAPESVKAGRVPAGVYVSAKAASRVYFNGHLLGENGVAAMTRSEETPGLMDMVFFAPRETLSESGNVIAIFMSSHHGFLHFGYPIHWIGLGEYQNPTRMLLNHYWPSLVPLGILLAGALYFFVMGFTGTNRLNAFVLSAVSLLAAGQLMTEVYRGLVHYAYTVHEWRLVLIVVFSTAFGICLIVYLINRFIEKKRFRFALAAGLVPASTFLITSYDGKAGIAIFTAVGVSAGVAAYAAFRRKPQARLHLAALSVFAVVLIAFPSRFLDVIFFYEIAALLLVLFIAQAISASRERRELEKERMLSRQLRVALAQSENRTVARQLRVKSAGKVEVVNIDEIACLKAAGDYVEIKLDSGKELLHLATLRQMEESLPPTFLRVHRSYLVKSDKIRSLVRETTGVGTLTLANETTVPVSRRIMPRVRDVLG